MKKALITGCLGQDGSYLTEYLLKKGYKVFGLARKSPFASHWALQWMSNMAEEERVGFIYGDMRDEMSLRNAIQKTWPDEIYNFAGQVFVPLSWDDPGTTFDVNVGGLSRILKIVEQVKRDTKVYQASTSEMFGNHEGACTDETDMRPTSPYGVSKLAAHRLVGLYRSRGLFVVGGILFNHESPRRGMEMVTRKIAMTVASWSAGGEDILALGNMDSRRDWGFAGEYVEAMHMMMQQIFPTDYVVGTGESHSVSDFLNECCIVAGISKPFRESHTKIDQRLTRQQEIFDMRADGSKLDRVAGWRSQIGFKELVSMMVKAEQKKLEVAEVA
jgi:GDPmannose 4,6-dehydratase